MRFRATPFVHPELSRLRERNESLARAWELGHVIFVLSLALAFAAPVGVALVALVDPEVPRERLWSAGIASAAACTFFAAIGFGIKRYASKKGSGA